MNQIFWILITTSVLLALVQGNPMVVTAAISQSVADAINSLLALAGLLIFWLGIARIIERSGLLRGLTLILQPLTRPLFPSIPRNHPAIGAILMNFSANILGLGSAATPFGLKAMEELQRLNPRPDTATPAMCTFLALNTSSLTLIPTTLISLRAAAGSQQPTEILGGLVLATMASTAAAILADYCCRRYYSYRGER